MVRPHAATVLPQASPAEALQTLEAATADVVTALLVAARKQNLADSSEGGTLTFTVSAEPGSNTIAQPGPPPQAKSDHLSSNSNITGASGSETQIAIDIPATLTLSQPLLQRLRRRYTAIQRGGIAHGQSHVRGRQAAVEGFVSFIKGEWATV